MRRLPAVLRQESGAVAGWEALPFGLLVFVIGTLVVANAWGVVDAKMAATAAAREGARAFVEAPGASAAVTAAHEAAAATVERHGRDPADASVAVEGSFARCERVVVTVVIAVPSIAVPWLGGLGPGLSARSLHGEIVDPLRSGVPGEADCASG